MAQTREKALTYRRAEWLDAEFMDGDAFLYVRDDHVCLCTTGLRDGAVRAALYDLFEKADLGDHATRFDLLKVANVNKIKMLHAQGVKEIILRATMYQATAQYEKRQAKTSGVLRAVARQVRAIVKAEQEEFDDSLRVTVSIKSDERFRKHLTLGERRLEQLAKDVVENQENYDDYLIITNAGQKVAPHEIYVTETMYIEALGKSVKYSKAWDHLQKFYRRLKKAGMLEQ